MSQKKNIIKYCKIRFRLMSPLEIGSGNNVKTDHDIMLTGNGTPFIPGSAIAGYFRDAVFRNLLQEMEKEEARQIIFDKLGYVIIEKEAGQAGTDDSQIDASEKTSDVGAGENVKESSVIFYDAFLNEETFHIETRDLVALDDHKVSLPGAKFDTEILEPDVTFDTYLEERLTSDEDESMINRILHIWASEDVAFGAKTTRGMGLTQLEQVWVREFNLNDETGVKKWVNFSVYEDPSRETFAETDKVTITDISSHENVGKNSDRDEWVINLSLEQVGGVSIRKYTTAVSTSDHTEPDYEQMKEHVWQTETKNADVEESGVTWISKELPVIPGSSWAGAFSHHMKVLMKAEESQMERWFGFVKGKGKEKSQIVFSDSVLRNAKTRNLSRNAIDRFSGGTVDGALFTERTYFGGKTKLKICFRKDYLQSMNEESVESKQLKSALAASIADLHAGFLAIGGLTSVGRGVFKVTGINGEAFSGNAEELYKKVSSILCVNSTNGVEVENDS